jgi:demethylmenaquinone methyltransferase/2-methoxy-6-polyprenyl-1,4-benzoquinol methylase
VSLWDVADYVRLRSGGDDEQLDEFAQRHAVRGKRVLELGCGPGRAAAALARRHGALVTALDASPSMLSAAREHVPAEVELVEGRAEALPFDGERFDAVLANFVVHLLDRPQAFSEARRVLVPGGVLVVKSRDPATVHDWWASPLFPSVESIERGRFPTGRQLLDELRDAGFEGATIELIDVERQFSKAEALVKLRSGAYSTMRLIPAEELEDGIRRAPHALDDPIRYTLTLLRVEARRPGR